ncbi:MAG: FtsX-like permease family protein [Planctomycetales bacterium]|nr:FtsX-like permease family protein [Planctomycetales bacterium]
MKTPLALLNLWHQGVKTGVSIGGVAFALLLVFMQLGFMGAVSHTATNLLASLKFDVLLRARDYLHLYEAGHIERKWLSVAENTPGVAKAAPLWITIHNWRRLPSQAQAEAQTFRSQYLPIAVMGYEPADDIFDIPQIAAQQALLFQKDTILIDDSTQANYGPWNGRKFSTADVGRETEIGGRSFTIRGLFQLGTGLAANGAVLTGHRGFARLTPQDIRRSASLGLVQLAPDSGLPAAQVLASLRERLQYEPGERGAAATAGPPGQRASWWQSAAGWLGRPTFSRQTGVVDVLSKEEALAREKYRWLWQTPIGLIFQLGVLLSLLVGAAIVYMVLATDVANRLPEYATLLAIGYSRKYLSSIVMTQAIVLAVLGFFAAWAAAEGLYRVTAAFSGIPMNMNAQRIAWVGLLGLFMCCLSGLLALRKLWKAEPASLF